MMPAAEAAVLPATVTALVGHQYVEADGRSNPMVGVGSGAVRLVWLPALMDAAASFTRVAVQIAGRLPGMVNVCAIDPPGYGDTSGAAPERVLPFAAMGTWINAVLDKLRGPFILAGNSSGAVMAALGAAERRDVLGLALVGWCDWRLVGTPHRELLCPTSMAELRRLMEVGWHVPPRPFANTLAKQLSYAQRADYRAHVASFSPEAFGAAFDRYQGPLALISGTSDGIITPTMVQALATQRPTAQLSWIQQCGHYPHREQPRQLADIFVRWIGKLLPASVSATEARSLGIPDARVVLAEEMRV